MNSKEMAIALCGSPRQIERKGFVALTIRLPYALSPRLVDEDMARLRKGVTPTGALTAVPCGCSSDYGYIWPRDNGYKALGAFQMGYWAFGRGILDGLFSIYSQHSWKWPYVWEAGRPDCQFKEVHAKYNPDGSETTAPWSHRQLDGPGLFLLLCSVYERHKPGYLTKERRQLLSGLARYIYCTQFAAGDCSTWEECEEPNSATISLVMAGVQACRSYLDDDMLCAEILSTGQTAMERLNGVHSLQRQINLAGLTPIFPAYLSVDRLYVDMVVQVLANEWGVARYLGDWYERESVEDPEPRWPLGLAWAAAAYACCGDFEAARECFDRLQYTRLSNGDFPESYVYRSGHWVPCPHTPLLWTHAFSLYCYSWIVLKRDPVLDPALFTYSV